MAPASHGRRAMPKERILIYSSLLTIALAGAGFYAFKQASDPRLSMDEVARIGNSVITADQLKAYMGQRSSASNALEIKKRLLQELIEREALIATAIDEGYEQDPAVVRALENALIARLRERQLNPAIERIGVSEDQVSRYYQDNIARYTTPAQKRAAIIKFELAGNAPAAESKRVGELAHRVQTLALSQLETIRGFGSLAAQYSGDQGSRYVGGDIGWHAEQSQSLDPALATALSGITKPGEISAPIKGRDGLYLLKLIDIRDERITPLESVASNIRIQLLQRMRMEQEVDWLKATVASVKPAVVNESLLSQMVVVRDEEVAAVRPPELPQ